MTDEVATAFIKVLKANEYRIIEQMNKTPPHISLLVLLLSLEPHCEILLKILAEEKFPRRSPLGRWRMLFVPYFAIRSRLQEISYTPKDMVISMRFKLPASARDSFWDLS